MDTTLTCRAWDVHTFLLMVGSIQFEHTDELNKRRKLLSVASGYARHLVDSSY